MPSVGLEEIIVNVKVIDNSGQKKEEHIEIPITSTKLPTAELKEPGGVNKIVSPKPEFDWSISLLGLKNYDYEQSIAYAKGESLWNRWLGIGREEFDLQSDQTNWVPPSDLDPGDYVWGIEIKKGKDKTQSSEYRFTVPKYWVNLTADEYVVVREDVDWNIRKLRPVWVVVRDNERIHEVNAYSKTTFDLEEWLEYEPKGENWVWMEGKINDRFLKISNEVLITGSQVDDEQTSNTTKPAYTPTAAIVIQEEFGCGDTNLTIEELANCGTHVYSPELISGDIERCTDWMMLEWDSLSLKFDFSDNSFRHPWSTYFISNTGINTYQIEFHSEYADNYDTIVFYEWGFRYISKWDTSGLIQDCEGEYRFR